MSFGSRFRVREIGGFRDGGLYFGCEHLQGWSGKDATGEVMAGFPKIGGPFGVSTMRTIVLWGVNWGPLFWETTISGFRF